jgi:putative ABC transport system ATP-binding protein/macrolide transport system ATP-binding/permease protein/lipoprotein-releasing system ATP-binding protein
MLEAHGLRKAYGSVTAVADVSLKVGTGEFVAVSGRSGSGKSTLLAMLGGLCRPTGGHVIADGVDLWSLSPRELARFRSRRVGFVLQWPSLLPPLRAIDNVALPALLASSRDLPAAYARAERLLREMGLDDRLEAYPSELSGGERCRVALARALVNRPPLVLADEPTGELDEETERDVIERLTTLHRAEGATLVFVTHSPELSRRAERVLHLRQGRMDDGERTSSAVRRPAPAVAASTASQTAAPTPPALGAGLRRFAWSFAAWAAAVVVGILALNMVVAGIQRFTTAQRQTARSELQRVALQQLRADVESIVPESDGSHRVTIYTENLDPRRELFVLGPAVRVFVQAHRGWTEVPSRAADGAERLIRLTGRRHFAFTFRPEVTAFDEQLAGYYHVRITNAMVVSRSSAPRDDLFERTDAYYVYVTPPGADDAELRRRNGWSGTPPVWIPMPAH